jgi:hypothetical protein
MSDLPYPYEVRATPDWPPVQVPGRPGWWRHLIDGEQVDLPHREVSAVEPEESP